ncbi:MAG: nitroreductase family protein [Bacteroidaceae bacterium]
MSTLLELCEKRHSVRKFSEKRITAEDLDYIMQCVRLAPSAVNYQPWKFLRVKDSEREKIRQCYTNPWFAGAQDYLIACCDHEISWHRRQDGKDHGDIDMGIAVEHFCLAAAERGVATCWVCAFDAVLCTKLFDLPKNLEPVAFLPLGYPAVDFVERERTRKVIEDLWIKR